MYMLENLNALRFGLIHLLVEVIKSAK